MKRLLTLFVIIILVVIAFFQYTNYRRFTPPSVYAYQTADSLDLGFYDPAVLETYFLKAEEVGSFGRYCWKTYGLDVLGDRPHNPNDQKLVQTYQQMRAHLRHLEARLKRSSVLKKKGYDNAAIRIMDTEGLSEEAYTQRQFFGNKAYFQLNDSGTAIFEAQKKLKEQGYELPVDGYFERLTEAAIKQFQTANNIYPTGRLDDLTARLLMK